MKIQIPLFLLALAGCTKPPHATTQAAQANSGGADSLVQITPMASFTLALETAAHSSLACATPDQCPASVGMLLSADQSGGFAPDSDSLAACTAVLISDDLVLTNSHCIPSAVKLLPDLCADRVRLVLPETANFPEENLACKALLGFSSRETPMSPDLALLRLERKTGRSGLPLSRAGVDPDSSLRSFRVNPDLSARTGTLVSDLCRAVAGSYRMPVYNSAADSVAVFGDCTALPGNSGSPLVDSAGDVRALMQATLPLSAQAAAEWSKHSEEAFAPLSMGTSLGCLSADPASGAWIWNNACVTIEDADVAAARPTIRRLLDQDPLAQDVSALLVTFLDQGALTRKEISTTALDRVETLIPACGPSPQTETFQIPTYSMSLRFNRYLQLIAPQVRLEKVENVQLTCPVTP